MTTTTTQIDALKRSPLFCSFADAEVAFLERHCELMQLEAHQIVFREGEIATELFVVLSGAVRISHRTTLGFEQVITILGENASFGEMGLLDRGPRSATAVATRPSVLIKIGRQALEQLAIQYPLTQTKLLSSGITLLASRLRDSNTSYWQLAARSVSVRMKTSLSRSRLLSLVSHELRTPLTVIKSSAQILRRGGRLDPTNFIEKILTQAEQLQALVEDLITLSLLQSGTATWEAAALDLGELIAEVAHELHSMAARGGVRIHVALSKGPTCLFGDRALLRRAFRHLAENAVRVSPSGSTVKLDVDASSADSLHCTVHDQGSGMTNEALERMRQSFVQTEDPLNRSVQGLGIGLAVVHEVIAAHGGRLSVAPTSGQGCCLVVALPRRPEGADAELEQERSVENA